MGLVEGKSTDELRKKAEELVAAVADGSAKALAGDVVAMVHEVGVYQAELQLQNEQLAEFQVKLQEARDRYAALFEDAPAGYVLLDNAGIIRRANRTFHRMVNRVDEDLRGRGFAEFLVPEDAPIFLSRFRSFFRNPADKQIVVRLRSQGRMSIPVRIESQVRRTAQIGSHVGGSEDELMVIVTDVSELKAARDRSEHLNRVLKAIRSVNRLVAAETDRSRLIRGVCSALTENLGYEGALIVLRDPDTGKPTLTAASGYRDGERERALRGLPGCVRAAIEADGLHVIVNPVHSCPDCPMADAYGAESALCHRLAVGAMVFGGIAVAVPVEYARDTEVQELFVDLAGELSSALGRIDAAESLRSARDELHYAQSVLSVALDHIQAGVAIAEAPDGRLTYMNRAGVLIGSGSDEMPASVDELNRLARSWEVVGLDGRPLTLGDLPLARAIGAGEAVSLEFQIRRSDGSLRTILSQAAPIRDSQGRITSGVVIFHDLSAKLKIEAEARYWENMLERVFDVLPVGLWFADKNGKLLRGNRAGVRIWGAEPRVAPQNYGVFKAWRLPSREPVEAGDWALLKTVTEGVSIENEVLEIEGFDGKRRTILNYTTPVFGKDGEVEAAIVVNLDISDRMALEAQLAQAHKLESIGRLAGGVAHDFNNLLLAIMNYVELCRENVGGEHPIRGWLDEIMVDAQRSAALTRQLLAFARKQAIVPHVLDLNSAVHDTLSMLRRLIGENIELKWTPAATPQLVKMDSGQVVQILTNLCVNARDAIGDAGTIEISTETVELDELFCRDNVDAIPGPYVVLSVADSGQGIDPAVASHIFEPFYTTKKLGEGTGLGLATVYGIARQNGGLVTVSSEPGSGAHFRVMLPLSTEVPPVVEPKAKIRQADCVGHETVLLVEDEPGLRLTSSLFLKKAGYNVLVAETPAMALDIAEEYSGRIHILVTDMVMPGMNGVQLRERLVETNPGLRCLLVSGYSEDLVMTGGLGSEEFKFMAKPFSRDELLCAVRSLLDE